MIERALLFLVTAYVVPCKILCTYRNSLKDSWLIGPVLYVGSL